MFSDPSHPVPPPGRWVTRERPPGGGRAARRETAELLLSRSRRARAARAARRRGRGRARDARGKC
jgi:hypothetical protein